MQNSRKDISISNKEVVVLGLSGAGWDDLISHRKNEGKKVYNHGDSCIPNKDSIYLNHHRHKLNTIQSLYLITSKAILVDAIQENIKRYHNNEPLIPVEMVIMALSEKENANLLIPDFTDVIKKNKKENQGVTNAEIRMVYKLMEEVPDPMIRSIMQASFFMMQKKIDPQGKMSFEAIENPWNAPQLQQDWENRTRARAASYSERETEKLPAWVNELIAYNKTCSLAKPQASTDTQEESPVPPISRPASPSFSRPASPSFSRSRSPSQLSDSDDELEAGSDVEDLAEHDSGSDLDEESGYQSNSDFEEESDSEEASSLKAPKR